MGDLGVGKDCRDLGEYPLPSPPPRERERVAADSSVAGRLKKNARNINGRNFSGSLDRKAGGTNAASVFFRRPLNPSVGCVPRGTHTVGWDCRENGEHVRACVPHTPYMRATACLPISLFRMEI